MIGRILTVLAAVVVIYLFYRWTQTKEDETLFDDYSHPKPPIYVYFNSSGIDMTIGMYFSLTFLLSIFAAVLTNRLLDNLPAAITVLFLALFVVRQYVVVRSINRNQRIDYDAPGFLTFFHNMMYTINKPLLALEKSADYADPAYKKTLKELATNLHNGGDPYTECQKVKRQFRNRILRSFLDDLVEEILHGHVLNTTLPRLIERAEDRKQFAEERKIETFSGVAIIYTGIIVEIVIGLIGYVIKPDMFGMFITTSLGQGAVLIMILMSGFMLIVAQRLILLSEA